VAPLEYGASELAMLPDGSGIVVGSLQSVHIGRW
jgi:hypothetical protein